MTFKSGEGEQEEEKKRELINVWQYIFFFEVVTMETK
jgi:hypothetical protein